MQQIIVKRIDTDSLSEEMQISFSIGDTQIVEQRGDAGNYDAEDAKMETKNAVRRLQQSFAAQARDIIEIKKNHLFPRRYQEKPRAFCQLTP